MPIPSRSRSLREPGFARGPSRTNNPSSSEVCGSSLKAQTNLEEIQLEQNGQGYGHLKHRPEATRLAGTQYGSEAASLLRHPQADISATKGDGNKVYDRSHGDGLSINFDRLHMSSGTQNSSRDGGGQGTAKGTSQLNSVRNVTMPPPKGLARSISLRQSGKSNTVLPTNSSGHTRHTSTTPPIISRSSAFQSERRDRSGTLISDDAPSRVMPSRTPHSRVATSRNLPRPASQSVFSSLAISGLPHLETSINDSITIESALKTSQPVANSAQRQDSKDQNQLKGATQHAQPTSGAKVDLRKAQSVSAAESHKPIKPQFSTYQQHFSPRKASSIRTGPSLSAVQSSGLDQKHMHASRVPLQTELLQLLIIHDASCRTRQQWEHDAKDRLQRRFDRVATKHQTSLESEQDARRILNDQALGGWCDGGGLDSLENRSRTLARAIQELAELSHSKGAYGRIVKSFNHRQNERNSNSGTTESFHMDSKSLGEDWDHEVALAGRKLDRCARALDTLGSDSPTSSLGEILTCHRDLAMNMQQELEIMTAIAREVARIEQERRKREIELVLADEDGPQKPRDEKPTAWQ